MTWSNPQTLGTVGATPIIAELGGGLSPAGTVRVTLSADYTLANLPGYPTRLSPGRSPEGLPRTIVSGTTIELLKPEAAALVVAGAASYA